MLSAGVSHGVGPNASGLCGTARLCPGVSGVILGQPPGPQRTPAADIDEIHLMRDSAQTFGPVLLTTYRTHTDLDRCRWTVAEYRAVRTGSERSKTYVTSPHV
ncbi:hypothetical protein BH11GEM2_BH11GEM2_15890 [soil metagenome]